jgi:hypothetical protein
MTDVLLLVLVVGAIALALGVDLAVLIGWLRGGGDDRSCKTAGRPPSESSKRIVKTNRQNESISQARGGRDESPATTGALECDSREGISMTKRKRDPRPPSNRQRGRPPVPIEQDPQRFELAAWWAFHEDGCGPFDAARRALLAVKGGPITLEDVEGVLHRASATVPLPPFDPDDPDKGLRRLAAKAKRAKPEPWLVGSAGLVQGLIIFTRENNMIGIAAAYDGLVKLGWEPIIVGLAKRVEAALGSNLAPADAEKLSPAVRRLLAKLRQGLKK